MVTPTEARQQLAQQEQQFAEARQTIQDYPVRIIQTQAQLRQATPTSQMQVRDVERQRAIEKQRASEELARQEAEFKIEAERVRGEIASYEAAEAEYARQQEEYARAVAAERRKPEYVKGEKTEATLTRERKQSYIEAGLIPGKVETTTITEIPQVKLETPKNIESSWLNKVSTFLKEQAKPSPYLKGVSVPEPLKKYKLPSFTSIPKTDIIKDITPYTKKGYEFVIPYVREAKERGVTPYQVSLQGIKTITPYVEKVSKGIEKITPTIEKYGKFTPPGFSIWTGEQIYKKTPEISIRAIQVTPLLKDIYTGREREYQLEQAGKKLFGMIGETGKAKTYEEQQAQIKQLETYGVKTIPTTTEKGEQIYQFEFPEAYKQLRPGFETKKEKEAFVPFFLRKLGTGYEQAYTSIAQTKVAGTPIATKEQAAIIGKGFGLVGQSQFYFLPGTQPIAILGGTTEKLFKGKESFIQFAKEEPLEVGMAALYSGGKAISYLRTPEIVKEGWIKKPQIQFQGYREIQVPVELPTGKTTTLSTYLLKTKYSPGEYSFVKQPRWKVMLGLKPTETETFIKTITPRTTFVKPVFSIVGEQPYTAMITKGKQPTQVILEKISQLENVPRNIQEFKSLPLQEQKLWQRFVERYKTGGTPVSLKSVPSYLTSEDILRSKSILAAQKIARVTPSELVKYSPSFLTEAAKIQEPPKSLIRFPTPGKTTTQSLMTTEFKELPVSEEFPFYKYVSRLEAKDITKPFSRFGKTTSLIGETYVLKTPLKYQQVVNVLGVGTGTTPNLNVIKNLAQVSKQSLEQGLTQITKITPSQIPKFIPPTTKVITPKIITTTKQVLDLGTTTTTATIAKVLDISRQKQNLALSPLQVSKQEPIVKQVPTQIPKIIPKQIPRESQISKQSPAQISKLSQIQSLSLKQIERQIPRQVKQTQLEEVTKTFPSFKFAFGGGGTEQKLTKVQVAKLKTAYQLLIRKRGKFVQVGKKTLPYGKALQLGVRTTKGGVAQTFRLVPSGTTSLADISYEVPKRLFTPYAKTLPKASLQFTELRGLTLTEFGERRELQMFKRRKSATKRFRLF